MGARPRGVGRPRRVRGARAEDALQGVPRRAARVVRAPSLRAPEHRQLQPDQRAALHRRQLLHCEGRDRRGRDGALQPAHRLLRAAVVEATPRGSAEHAREAHRPHRPRGRARARRTAGPHRCEAQLARRRARHRGALPGVAGRRRHRPHRARRVLPPARHARGERAHPGDLHRRSLSRARTGAVARERRRARGLPLVGRLDAAQLRAARRGDVPHRGSEHPVLGARHAPRAAARRQREGPGDAPRRQLRSPSAEGRRGAVPVADVVHGSRQGAGSRERVVAAADAVQDPLAGPAGGRRRPARRGAAR